MLGESSAELSTPHLLRLTRLARLGSAGLLLLGSLAACAAPPTAADLADRLEAALASRDEAGFVATFTPGTQSLASSWYQAFSRTEQHAIRATGPDRFEVRYQFPGDGQAASNTLALQLSDDRIDLVSPTDQVTPLWLLPHTSVISNERATLISAGLEPAEQERWLNRIERAATELEQQAVSSGWEPGAVVEIPGTGNFAKVSGTDAASASAVTRCDWGNSRIIVNPVVLDQGSRWLDSTLVHELTHVATDSACHPGGIRWVVEGVAEAAAAESDPETAKRNRRLVAARLASDGLPRELPEQVSDLSDYALAQVAVEQLRHHLGAEAERFITTAITTPEQLSAAELEQARGWYRAELKRRAAQ